MKGYRVMLSISLSGSMIRCCSHVIGGLENKATEHNLELSGCLATSNWPQIFPSDQPRHRSEERQLSFSTLQSTGAW